MFQKTVQKLHEPKWLMHFQLFEKLMKKATFCIKIIITWIICYRCISLLLIGPSKESDCLRYTNRQFFAIEN